MIAARELTKRFGGRTAIDAVSLDVAAGPAHRALDDARVTAALLLRELQLCEDPRALCWQPIEVQRMPFGKHRGEPISAIPEDYLSWLLHSGRSVDEDLRWTMEMELANRRHRPS